MRTPHPRAVARRSASVCSRWLLLVYVDIVDLCAGQRAELVLRVLLASLLRGARRIACVDSHALALPDGVREPDLVRSDPRSRSVVPWHFSSLVEYPEAPAFAGATGYSAVLVLREDELSSHALGDDELDLHARDVTGVHDIELLGGVAVEQDATELAIATVPAPRAVAELGACDRVQWH